MSGSASSSAQNDDTSLSLCELRRRTAKPLLHSVVDIYKSHRKSNDKSIQFWKDLKCYSPQHFDTERRIQDFQPSDRIPLELHSAENGYVALSYCWKPSKGESKKRKKYRIASEMEKRLKVRDIVLDRTFRFIRYKQACGAMLPLWIDQLSIEQEGTPEKDIAMQSMDLVYKKCTYAVGYLWTQLQTQIEMDRLSDLLSGRIVQRNFVEGNPTLIDGINNEVVREVLNVLTRITNDIWWTRAWIFQEDYLAGKQMWLMMRHVPALRKPLGHGELGSLRGEVVVRSDELKTYATLFCLACYDTMRQDLDIIEQCMEVLRKAGKYNILHKYQYAKVDRRSMTIRIFKDLDRRVSKYRTDLLPIVANVCSYDVRLATKEKGFKRQSLSLSILALYIANGELLANLRGGNELENNVFEFLRKNSLRICAPLPDGELTLIKHCRLSAYLECTGPSSTHDDWPPQHSMNAMASSVVDAMDTGKYLQLARPIGGSLDLGRGVPYRAILVWDRNDLQSVGSTYVFTSWSRTNKRNKGIMETRKIAKYVSLVVYVDEGVGNGAVRLKSKRWINGLCFFGGEKKFPFVFEWPESLSQ
ncbi:Heterokaryon incompatibility [Pyrenophora seminiperda CCB06]|uniref:Heterokaryon incompatibility n=1 Tax=Pyrenophora seminiperda CCB06 TaxID=1302712 RepID=A0A3M7LZX1_9PLEO|nr:Heterokaryon incompatibility [Pyrenophora seminiperda CCB06]